MILVANIVLTLSNTYAEETNQLEFNALEQKAQIGDVSAEYDIGIE